MESRPQTIDDVLIVLDDIIEETKREKNYLGIFAYVYRRTTAQIKAEIEAGRFKNNEEMERFDVLFANFYIDAYRAFKAGKPHAQCWATSFEARNQPLTIMQHLVMGMNAHISHDLGIAAAKFAPGDKIHTIEEDFMLVNEVLKNLTEEMQEKIGRVSPLLFILDWVGKKRDEQVANFSIVQARKMAWKLACTLAPLDEAAQVEPLQQADQLVTGLSKRIKAPKSGLSRFILGLICQFEEKDIPTIITKISAP